MWIQLSVQSRFEWICWEIVDLRIKRNMVVRIVGMEAMGNGEGEMILGLRFRDRENGERTKDGFFLVNHDGFGSLFLSFFRLVAQ
jgi:hypothetical protein